MVRGALLSIEEVTKQIGFQYSKFRDERREWEARHLAVSLPSHTLRGHLRQAIGELIPTKRRNRTAPRLAVFIDDIDRCEPDVAYRLLEGLKIYLTLDNCVFIFGMNQRTVEDAIAKRMSFSPNDVSWNESLPDDIEKSEHAYIFMKSRSAAYMEKLCQNVWQLPSVRNPANMIQSLIGNTVEDSTARQWIREVVKQSPYWPPNPHRLKGFANLLGRLALRLPAGMAPNDEGKRIEALLLVVVAYIYQFHSELYVRWEADISFYNHIRHRCLGRKLKVPVLDSLILPQTLVTDDREPTPDDERSSSDPDPTETRVFLVLPLILTLGDEVTSEQFERYVYQGTHQSDIR